MVLGPMCVTFGLHVDLITSIQIIIPTSSKLKAPLNQPLLLSADIRKHTMAVLFLHELLQTSNSVKSNAQDRVCAICPEETGTMSRET